MESWAPFRVTAIEAAAVAYFTAFTMVSPLHNLLANTPLKQSPAPTVSTAFTLTAGISMTFSFSLS